MTYTERIFIEFPYLSLSYLSVGDSALCRLILKTFHLITKALLYHHFDIGGPDCVTDGWSKTAVPRMSSMVSHLISQECLNEELKLDPWSSSPFDKLLSSQKVKKEKTGKPQIPKSQRLEARGTWKTMFTLLSVLICLSGISFLHKKKKIGIFNYNVFEGRNLNTGWKAFTVA